MTRGHQVAMGLLRAAMAEKQAGGSESAGKVVGKAIRGYFGAAADIGGGLAKGLGANEQAGRVAGVIGAGGLAAHGGARVKGKYENWRMRQYQGWQ